MYECPICGKSENRRGNQFTDVSNVIGHIDGSHDDAHRGVSGAEMRVEIEATAETPEDVDATDTVPEEEVEPVQPSPETSEQDTEGGDEEPEVVPVDTVDEAAGAAYDSGYQEAHEELSTADPGHPPEEDSSSQSSGLNPVPSPELKPADYPTPGDFDGEHCPLCGSVLGRPGEGAVFVTAYRKGVIRRRYERVVLEEDDLICGVCDVAIEPDGTIVPGSDYSPPQSAR
jgi:hypothetical protein